MFSCLSLILLLLYFFSLLVFRLLICLFVCFLFLSSFWMTELRRFALEERRRPFSCELNCSRFFSDIRVQFSYNFTIISIHEFVILQQTLSSFLSSSSSSSSFCHCSHYYEGGRGGCFSFRSSSFKIWHIHIFVYILLNFSFISLFVCLFFFSFNYFYILKVSTSSLHYTTNCWKRSYRWTSQWWTTFVVAVVEFVAVVVVAAVDCSLDGYALELEVAGIRV